MAARQIPGKLSRLDDAQSLNGRRDFIRSYLEVPYFYRTQVGANSDYGE